MELTGQMDQQTDNPTSTPAACGNKCCRLRNYYWFMVCFATVISGAVYIGVKNGWLGQLQLMDQACGFFCFPHDIFYPKLQAALGLSNEPALFGIPVWAIVGGFVIIFTYFSLLFLPALFIIRAKTLRTRLAWFALQTTLIAAHLILYAKITFPQI